MKGDEMSETFFADGENLSAQEAKEKFLSFSIGKRQEKCLELIELNHQFIIDLGCYTGLFCEALQKKYPEKNIIAGDYDDNNLKIARFIYPHISHLFKKINVYQINYDKDYFDCVIFQDVIEHLEGAANAIKEINRVLKQDGVLIITTPSPYYYKDLVNFVKYEIIRKFKKNLKLSSVVFFDNVEWNRHVYCWTPSTLYTLLNVNGFEYVMHDYCQEGQGLFSKLLLYICPFLSPTMILKVKKKRDAEGKIV